MRDIIKSIEVGHKTIMGTAWPIEYGVERRIKFGKPIWILHKACCNGSCEGSQLFKTKKAALEALREYES